jgi:hypothetical protein
VTRKLERFCFFSKLCLQRLVIFLLRNVIQLLSKLLPFGDFMVAKIGVWKGNGWLTKWKWYITLFTLEKNSNVGS